MQAGHQTYCIHTWVIWWAYPSSSDYTIVIIEGIPIYQVLCPGIRLEVYLYHSNWTPSCEDVHFVQEILSWLVCTASVALPPPRAHRVKSYEPFHLGRWISCFKGVIFGFHVGFPASKSAMSDLAEKRLVSVRSSRWSMRSWWEGPQRGGPDSNWNEKEPTSILAVLVLFLKPCNP